MSSEAISFKAAFEQISSPSGPSPETVEGAFAAIFAGAWTPVQVAGFLVGLRMRGETAPVIAAAARAMRSAMVSVDHGLEATLDTCGTGGDGFGTLNLSTAAAIIAASSGVAVAKHGNRAATSRTGSADVLEALGIPIDLPPDQQARVLREANITFLFAQAHHPAMRHAAVARRELGIRTILNVLGPLSNPARATHQLLGAYADALRPVMAECLRSLGVTRAWVVWGEDGLDEMSPCGPTRVAELRDHRIVERVVTPEDFGLPRISAEALRGGDAGHNAAILRQILAGEPHPARPGVVLNAAAALVVALDLPFRDATRKVEETIASGGALSTLDRWKKVATLAKTMTKGS